MIRSLSDLLVVSDMDNTLLTAEKGISDYNINSIRYFTSLGGRFTVATGRTVESVRHYLKQLPLSAPAITFGGAVLYNFKAEQRITNILVNKAEAGKAIDEILEAFNDVGVEIMAENGKIYVVKANELTYNHTLYEKLEYILSGYHDIPCGWNKVLFATSNETQLRINSFINKRKYSDIYFLATHKNYYEIMNNKASKGSALIQLCQYCNIPTENSFAIGDYYNDLELLRCAGYSAAVQNAPYEVQKEADEVVASCEEGGVGMFLHSLIKRYGN